MNFLFLTKSVDAAIAESQAPGRQMVRALDAKQITLLGIGSIVGAGIFATIGTACAGDAMRPGAGPALIASFALTALACAFVALCYAELASMIPISGSAYTYSYATLGEVVAWMIGWDLLLEYAVSAVAVAISWSAYLNSFLSGFGLAVPGWLSMNSATAHGLAEPARSQVLEAAPILFGEPLIFNFPALFIAGVLTVVLVIGIRESARMNSAMVLINLFALALFIIVGAMWVRPDNWTPFAPNGIAGISAGAAIVFFAYIGFDAVSTVAEETKNPQRDLPIGILASLVVVTILYMAVAAIFTGLIPFDRLKGLMTTAEASSPLTLALDFASPQLSWMAGILAAAAVVAQAAVLLVVILGQTRILSVMARDGLLPQVFSKLHPRFRTPFWPTIMTGSFVGIAAAIASLDTIVNLTNIGTLFAFVLVCAGVIVLRLRQPDQPRKFRVPGGWPWAIGAGVLILIGLAFLPMGMIEKAVIAAVVLPLLAIGRQFVLPMLGIAACGYLIVNLPITSLLRFVAWLNIGFVIYCGYGVAHSKLQQTSGIRPAEGAENRLKMAIMSTWLALIGVFLAIGVRAVEIFVDEGGGSIVTLHAASFWKDAGDIFHLGTWMEISWFMILPLIGNGLLLCPVLSWRLASNTSRSDAPALELRRKIALGTSLLITISTIAYLISVFGPNPFVG